MGPCWKTAMFGIFIFNLVWINHLSLVSSQQLPESGRLRPPQPRQFMQESQQPFQGNWENQFGSPPRPNQQFARPDSSEGTFGSQPTRPGFGGGRPPMRPGFGGGRPPMRPGFGTTPNQPTTTTQRTQQQQSTPRPCDSIICTSEYNPLCALRDGQTRTFNNRCLLNRENRCGEPTQWQFTRLGICAPVIAT